MAQSLKASVQRVWVSGLATLILACVLPMTVFASPIRWFHQKEPVLLQQARPDNLYAIVREWQRQLDSSTQFRLVSPRVWGQVIQADDLQAPSQRESVTP